MIYTYVILFLLYRLLFYIIGAFRLSFDFLDVLTLSA